MEKKANRLKVRSLTTKLLKDCLISEPPVKLAIVSKKLSLYVARGDVEILDLFKKRKLSAFIDLEEKIVVYNGTHSVVRNRFSVAHEIGHLVLGHHFGRDIFDLESKDPREIEANMFAAELLLPFSWLKTDMAMSLRIPDLARRYWVSEEAVGWRLFKSDALLLK